MFEILEEIKKAEVLDVSVEKSVKQRPQVLCGSTYKITPPSGAALYVTINDIVDSNGVHKPFEIFINSKNMEHYQWIVALTRVISAVFRYGEDVSFLAEELKSVFDPKGGYFKNGKWIPSLVAEIGICIETHIGIETQHAPKECENCE